MQKKKIYAEELLVAKGWVKPRKSYNVKRKLVIKNKKKQFAKEFEEMIENAEMKSLANVSLERPLTKREYIRYKELVEEKIRKLGMIKKMV